MDTLSNLPFILEFKIGNKLPNRIVDFYSDENSVSEDTLLEITENVPVEVLFKSEHEDSKLFFEGLESIPERFVEEEDGIPYLAPAEYPIKIFKQESYPLIPGKYLLRVDCLSISYYTLVAVKPNRVTEEQWEIMKEEVEEQLSGLAQDLIKSRMGLVYKELKMLAPRQISQFLILQKHYAKALAAITDLYTKANYRIKKNYQMVPIERVKTTDEKSVIHRLKYPEKQTELKSPINTFEYDLPENRWAKKIAQFVIINLKEFNNLVTSYAENIKFEIDYELRPYAEFQENTRNVLIEKEKVLSKLEEYLIVTKKIQNAFQMLQSAKWYHEVNEHKPCPLPHVMQLDARYRVLYQMYREMKQEKPELGIDPIYALQWKRTDKLYEIWGFVQLVNAIKELEFNPINGWIYSGAFNQQKNLIPNLNGGTTITFRNEKLILKLTYDGKIPYQRQDTDPLSEPLYISSNNNRPDSRLDVYEEDIYIGSLIIDFKYRSKRSVWDLGIVNTSHKSKTMSQLLSYGSSCKSIHLYGANNGITHNNPIQEVWAIYPSQYNSNHPIEDYEDHHLRLIKLSPIHNKDYLKTAFQEVITKLISRRNK
ncbi:DUF2357 domain-containing protein [Fictibacillus sp. B-59209]|uniref:DUF2357 domain-containing protein n=1 Tax=Fictibacillus sp. B-59209 TaxID=3024873 RepID=UPI002E1FC9ED|nr:DUF2357 domain-containing protein [Fictibacillus sp. B-59209]